MGRKESFTTLLPCSPQKQQQYVWNTLEIPNMTCISCFVKKTHAWKNMVSGSLLKVVEEAAAGYG